MGLGFILMGLGRVYPHGLRPLARDQFYMAVSVCERV